MSKHSCEFTVHGVDADEIERQAKDWIARYIGDRLGVVVGGPMFSNVQPISIRMDGSVAVWSADVSARVDVAEAAS